MDKSMRWQLLQIDLVFTGLKSGQMYAQNKGKEQSEDFLDIYEPRLYLKDIVRELVEIPPYNA